MVFFCYDIINLIPKKFIRGMKRVILKNDHNSFTFTLSDHNFSSIGSRECSRSLLVHDQFSK